MLYGSSTFASAEYAALVLVGNPEEGEIMPITVEKFIINIIQSLYYFLNNMTYTKEGVTKTLKEHFSDPQLDIILGFPQSLQELVLPTISLVLQPIPEKIVTAYRNQYDEIIYAFNIYGFCGGEQSYETNQHQRDDLCNDIRTVLEESEFFNIYSVSEPPIASDFVTALTEAELLNVRSRNLPPTGILIADRYRFLIEFDVSYVRSIMLG